MSELQDLTSLVRANTALIVIETPDEPRVVDLFRHLLMNVWRPLYRWSITEGLRRVDLDGEDPPIAPTAVEQLETEFRYYLERERRLAPATVFHYLEFARRFLRRVQMSYL